MSKRPFASLEEESANHFVNGSYKKTCSEFDTSSSDTECSKLEQAAMLGLCENADNLIACLKNLKEWHKTSQGRAVFTDKELITTKQQLSELGKTLSPLFAKLGYNDERSEPSGLSDKKSPSEADKYSTSISSPSLSSDTAPRSFLGSAWKVADIPTQLPPLPKVKDSQIEQLAFRHPGLGVGPNYERLEWLGDAYLELIATSLIYQTFPDISSGRCSQIREQLIRNTTLSGYFRQYNMQQRAQLPPDFDRSQHGRGRSSDKDLIKTQGDMFEAFVAAVIVSDPNNGLANAIDWLKKLFSTTLREQIERNERAKQQESKTHSQPQSDSQATAPKGQALNAKDRLRQLIGCKKVTIEYKDMPGTGQKKSKENGMPLFSIGVYFSGWGETDKLLAVCNALNKKEAGQKAAATVLENRKLMKVYEGKKKEFMDAQEREMLLSSGAVATSGQ